MDDAFVTAWCFFSWGNYTAPRHGSVDRLEWILMCPSFIHIHIHENKNTGWTKQEALESLVRKAGYNVSKKKSCVPVPLDQHNDDNNGKQKPAPAHGR